MNLAVAADDIELKMTHVVRGKDHKDNAKKQEMIFKILNKKFPQTFFMGRLKFTDLILSKRKLNEAIKSGKFSSAEDERVPTVASLRKRNYRRETFEKFAIQRGLTEVDRVISAKDFFELLDTLNRNI
jgi:glutamyl-tRNA synthetase